MPLMLLNEVLGEVLRIERIFRQPQGPPLLRGRSGAGKTTLVRSGCKDEKIRSIFDESKMMDSGFVDRMNPLWAIGEVPGRFEGDEHTPLMTQCKKAPREGSSCSTQTDNSASVSPSKSGRTSTWSSR